MSTCAIVVALRGKERWQGRWPRAWGACDDEPIRTNLVVFFLSSKCARRSDLPQPRLSRPRGKSRAPGKNAGGGSIAAASAPLHGARKKRLQRNGPRLQATPTHFSLLSRPAHLLGQIARHGMEICFKILEDSWDEVLLLTRRA